MDDVNGTLVLIGALYIACFLCFMAFLSLKRKRDWTYWDILLMVFFLPMTSIILIPFTVCKYVYSKLEFMQNKPFDNS